MVGRRFGMPLLREYGRYIRLDENRLLIGRYLFFRYGNAVVFFGRFIAVLRMFAALLAGANSMPAGRFFFFNVTGGICWACLFGFGAYAAGTEIYKISEAFSLVSLGLFIGAGSALSIIIRRYEIVLLRKGRARAAGSVMQIEANVRCLGPFETCRLALKMSVCCGRPEVIGGRPKRRY
jgi:membrane protein DedA with SNARE-associated domain